MNHQIQNKNTILNASSNDALLPKIVNKYISKELMHALQNKNCRETLLRHGDQD